MGALSPPDPSQIGNSATSIGKTIGKEQTAANVGAQASNQYNWADTGGTITYGQTGVGPNGMPIYGITSAPSAAAAPSWANMYAGKALAGAGANSLLQGADYGSHDPTSSIGSMASGLTNERMQSYLAATQPFMTTQKQQLDTQLRNQGQIPGQPAYDNAMRQLDVNQGMTVSGAAAQFQPQAFQQATSLYQMPMTMGEQLSQWGTPQTTTPTVQGPQMQPADYTSASAVGAKLSSDQYAAQMAQYSGMLGGMSNIAGAGLGFALLSDERLKENKDEVGSLHDGTPVYKYNYLGDPTPRIGLMAQDVEKTTPDAVHEIGGYKAVNYDRATARSRAMKALLG